MILKRIFSIFIVFTLVITFLTSCRLKGSQEQAGSFQGITLTYYKMFDDEDVIKPIIDEYVATHPGLKINYKKFTDFDEYIDLILNEMAEGEGPDIFSMQNTWFTGNYKKIYPMPDEFGTIEDFALTFVDVAYKDLITTDTNGIEKVFALPMTVDTLALYYNKDHFEDRIPTRGKPATTWEGIEEDVQLLTKEDNSFSRFEVSGIAMGRADNISRAVDILYLLFLQNGLSFYNENVSKAIFANKQSGATDNGALAALDFFISFADPDQKNYTWNEFVVSPDSNEKEIEAFARGDVSMIVGYAYTYDEIVNQMNILDSSGIRTIDKSAIRIAPIPQLYDPDVSSQKRVTYASYFAETVSRNTQYPDIAWDFLIFLTSKTNQEFYFDKLHKPTSRRDLIEQQRQDPTYGVFASQIGFAESFPIIDYYKYKEIFSNLISSANESGTSVKLLNDAQDLIDGFLPEEGFIVPKAEVEE